MEKEPTTPEQLEEFKKKQTEYIKENLDFVELRARFEKANAEIICSQRDALKAQIEIPQMLAHLESLKNPGQTENPGPSKLVAVKPD